MGILDIPDRIAAVCRKLRGAGHAALVVGGSVRDLLMGRSAGEFDLATSASPDEVCRVFPRTVKTGIKHGTVTVLIGRDGAGDWEGVEVTTFRGEGAYSDGRRPDEVVFVRTIEEDLARRDFTVNAIAYDPVDDRLVDPHGGRDDLARRLLRAVGDPRARFSEDGLRAMRAVRFAAVLGFAIEPETLAAIPRALHVFRKVSSERVRDELIKMLAADRPSIGVERMRETGLLAEVIPELCEGVGLRQNRFHAYDVYQHSLACMDATRGDPILRLAALLHDVGKPRAAQPRTEDPSEMTFYRHEVGGAEMADAISRRLKLSNQERERCVALVRHHMFWYTEDWSAPTVRRFIRRVGKERLEDLFALRGGDVVARGRGEDPRVEIAALRQRIDEALVAEAALKITDLAIGGQDVARALDVPPGPIIGKVLRALLERVTDDPSLNTKERLEALVPEVARNDR
ncbi:MAG: HDIG domain-containing metalloprotein [Myxococcota bacterium]